MDLSQTAANVGIGNLAAGIRGGTAGEALTQGQPVYRDFEQGGKWFQGDADDADKLEIGALVLTPAATDGFAALALPGSYVNLGATLVAGTEYYLSPTKGAICDFGTLGTGDYVVKLGAAYSTSLLLFDPVNLGVKKA